MLCFLSGFGLGTVVGATFFRPDAAAPIINADAEANNIGNGAIIGQRTDITRGIMFKGIGTVIFGGLFLLINPTGRQLILRSITEAWSGRSAWTPATFALLAAPLAAALVVIVWPRRR